MLPRLMSYPVKNSSVPSVPPVTLRIEMPPRMKMGVVEFVDRSLLYVWPVSVRRADPGW